MRLFFSSFGRRWIWFVSRCSSSYLCPCGWACYRYAPQPTFTGFIYTPQVTVLNSRANSREVNMHRLVLYFMKGSLKNLYRPESRWICNRWLRGKGYAMLYLVRPRTAMFGNAEQLALIILAASMWKTPTRAISLLRDSADLLVLIVTKGKLLFPFSFEVTVLVWNINHLFQPWRSDWLFNKASLELVGLDFSGLGSWPYVLYQFQSRLQQEMKKVPKLKKFWNLIKKNYEKLEPKAAEQ